MLIPLLVALKKEKRHDDAMFTFDFSASSNPHYAIPYVATIQAEGKKMVRTFFELTRVYAKDSVLVEGSYAAREGEIIERCKGGNSSRKYRSLYLVYMGRLEFLGKTDDAKTKHHVLEYLTHQTDILELRTALL